MSDREVEFDSTIECDLCGAKGAFDFYGDFICQNCINRMKQESEDDD